MSARIDPTASVDAGAEIGDDVEIGPGAVIEAGVRIERGARILARAVICRGSRIGEGAVVHPGAVVGGPPQDAKYKGEPSYCEIGARTVVRECATVNRGTGEGSCTRVGSDCMLMIGSHVGHNCAVGDRVVLANGAQLAGHVEVGDGAFLSALTTVHQYCRVGRLAMLGGGAMISLDLPPFVIGTSMTGNRVCGLNVVGLRRAGFSPAVRTALKRAYRVLFRSAAPLEQRLTELAASGVAEVAEWVAFVRSSSRGVITRHQRPRAG